MLKIEDLRRIRMLKGMPEHLLKMIGQEAQLSIIGTGTRLFSKGDRNDILYMLVMGQVALSLPLNEEIDVIFENLQAGGILGAPALIENGTAGYNAVCQEPCEMITLYGPSMIELFETNHELAYYMMGQMASRYEDLMNQRGRIIIKTLVANPDLRITLERSQDAVYIR